MHLWGWGGTRPWSTDGEAVEDVSWRSSSDRYRSLRGGVKSILEGPGQHIGRGGATWLCWRVVIEAEEEGTEAVIHPEAVQGGKDRSSAWVISTAITEGRVTLEEVTLAELLLLEVMTSAYSKNAVTIRTTCACHKIKL